MFEVQSVFNGNSVKQKNLLIQNSQISILKNEHFAPSQNQDQVSFCVA